MKKPAAPPKEAFLALAERFTAAFPPALSGPRTVGREAEFPIVTAEGKAADLRRLWDLLLAPGDLRPSYGPSAQGHGKMIVSLVGEDFTYALEVGVGTVEINTRPCRHLLEVEAIMETAVSRLLRAVARLGWRLLAYGIQPVTAPTLSIMAPKQRYFGLYRAMGASWLWYTITASDQLHVAVSRPEMVDVLNFANLMAPVIIAFCANSPVYADSLSPYCSAREGEMATIYAIEHRHGMLPRAMRSMPDYVATVAQATHLIVRDDREIYPSSRRFAEHAAEYGPDYDAFLFHEHYIWNSARLRAQYGTVEMRPACQQPWREHMAAAALELGLIEAYGVINHSVQRALGSDYWSIMQTYHEQTIRYGLRAPEPAPNLLATILQHVEDGLRTRNFGEEQFLHPLWRRLERCMNPAQTVRRVYHSDGRLALLNHVTIRPGI